MPNRLATLAAALSLATLAACSGNPATESTGEYIDDTAITTKIKAAYVQDDNVRVANIGVETFKGVVQLSGYAGSSAEIDQAVRIASQVPGVKGIRNDIALKPGASAGQ